MKLIISLLISVGCFAQNTLSIIPKPQSIDIGKGKFSIDENTQIAVSSDNTEATAVAEQLAIRLKIIKNRPIEIVSANSGNNKILFLKNSKIAKEGYELRVSNKNITIEASNPVGHFYGLQTLLQLLPSEIFGASIQPNLNLSIPACTIKDEPRFEYRGIMLDLGRHFFSIEFLKKMVDVMAINKMNTFHIHLTEDQGWRIEIKKYPKLTEIGSIRKESMVGHYRDQKYDGTPYGGFYTQDQMRDLVAYAQRKFITIVPEIEMPGHALAALASYPELGCTGEQFEVGTKWGVEPRVFCPNEKTFSFLEDVLTEIMDIFPSQYIHIGGDECPKEAWKKSDFCQNLMKKEGLKDEHELQSYFIRRIDQFVSSKGRKIIGWDEILEGGLSPNATVMSWRGVEGGIAAAKQKHDVIMSPNSHMYLDYYQANPSTEPLAIGGLLPIEKTYSFEPFSPELTTEEAKYIKGVQANLWTEYVATPEYAEYMLFPRAIATAEIGWSDKTKDFEDFSNRLMQHFKRLDQMAVNYSKAFYNVSFTTEKNSLNQPVLSMSSNDKNGVIRYTIDGTMPNSKSFEYSPKNKITIGGDRNISAALFSKEGNMISTISSKSYTISKSTGKSYSLGTEPKKYFGGEKMALTNGIRGDENSNDPWVGFNGGNLDFTLDFGQKTSFSNVSIGFLGAATAWIMPPKSLEIFTSDDNKTFKSIKKMDLGLSTKNESFVQQLNISVGTANAKYLKIVAENYGKLPIGHPGQGSPSWLFVDEISVK
ncbi:beta-N-acetylhexosaminidase [Lacihabitans sp. LS3-19]|uniref:family 20 glycosylhydrolase n=1 Tax=Lacihabitans sp. LS3-19 TaxID=2487335 RepID=UPI0020CDDE9D|nr:family 20 glycosylhydrolase [Lacihabitans sp. LS3-19]MCP9770104.1 beta-N-acetylhexosaminidase [Lacihabitans sp. LS3-19]